MNLAENLYIEDRDSGLEIEKTLNRKEKIINAIEVLAVLIGFVVP